MKSAENIEKLIKNLDLDIDTNAKTDQRILKELIESHEKSKKMKSALVEPNIRRTIMKSPITKVAALVAVVICAGAIATTVGLKVRKYYFVGREPDGTYVFQTEPEEIGDGRTVSRKAGTWVDPNRTIDVEQKRKDFEEIDLLRQQDARELVGVGEEKVNGKLQPRSFIFKYELADGREKTVGEPDPDTQDREDSLTATEKEELLRLRLQRVGKEEYIGNDFLQEVKGRMFVFKRQRFVLSDGTEVIDSTGKPK